MTSTAPIVDRPTVTADRYLMRSVKVLPPNLVKSYWVTLMQSGLLKKRIADVDKPTLRDVKEMLDNKGNLCFLMLDPTKQMVCGETMLNNINGLCGQVHFSIHPAYHGKAAVGIARAGAEQYFRLINVESGFTLQTLIGITPESNRLALKLIKKVGFKVFDIIDGMFYNRETKTYISGCISKLRPRDLYGD